MSERQTRFAHTRTYHHHISVSGTVSEILVANELNLQIKHFQVAPTEGLDALRASRLSLCCLINDEQFHLLTLLKMPFS
jgi:hypothetical protein